VYYVGVEIGHSAHHMCALREVRVEDPPVRLAATFFEPGDAVAVAGRIRALGEAAIAIAAPMTEPRKGQAQRTCDELLQMRGITPRPASDEGRKLFEELADLGLYSPGGDDRQGNVAEGTFQSAPVFETNVDAVFASLQSRRLPARRNPLGIQRRIDELLEDHVIDEGGDLWHRRIDEIEACGAALCAHRYAVGHARWIGDPAEGVIVMPGSSPVQEFSTDGVLPPVKRVPL
jgi:hypothetical protein